MIITLGSFDGYHKGHQKLFETASALAKEAGTGWAVVTFTPHPRMVLLNEKISLLFSGGEKKILEALLEIPTVFSLPFTSQLSSMSPVEFFSYMRGEFPLRGVVVGYDFHFGKGRAGDAAFLQKICSDEGITFKVVPALKIDGTVVSSTAIRDLVERGKLEKAEKFLGYPFFLQGEVTGGSSRGRSMGLPTANLEAAESKIIPPSGVYAGAVFADQAWLPAAISVGNNPTFGGLDRDRIEVHIIGYDGCLYGETLRVIFFEKMRPTYKFPDADKLKNQIKRDIFQARDIFVKKNPSLEPFKKPSVLKAVMFRDMMSPVQ